MIVFKPLKSKRERDQEEYQKARKYLWLGFVLVPILTVLAWWAALTWLRQNISQEQAQELQRLESEMQGQIDDIQKQIDQLV